MTYMYVVGFRAAWYGGGGGWCLVGWIDYGPTTGTVLGCLSQQRGATKENLDLARNSYV